MREKHVCMREKHVCMREKHVCMRESEGRVCEDILHALGSFHVQMTASQFCFKVASIDLGAAKPQLAAERGSGRYGRGGGLFYVVCTPCF
jgi:hypothetical protein